MNNEQTIINNENNERRIIDPDVEANKLWAAASYVWILCLIPLLTQQKSKFAQFHAKQGFVLLILSLFTIVPVFGWLLFLAIVIASVLGIIKAHNGEWYQIPFVYDLSKKIKI